MSKLAAVDPFAGVLGAGRGAGRADERSRAHGTLTFKAADGRELTATLRGEPGVELVELTRGEELLARLPAAQLAAASGQRRARSISIAVPQGSLTIPCSAVLLLSRWVHRCPEGEHLRAGDLNLRLSADQHLFVVPAPPAPRFPPGVLVRTPAGRIGTLTGETFTAAGHVSVVFADGSSEFVEQHALSAA